MMPDETEESWRRRSNERNWAILRVVDEVARARRATHSQVSLARLPHQPAVCSVILGARTMSQLDDSLAADQLSLSAEELSRLSQASGPDAPYPYRFLKLYGSRNPTPEV